MQTSDADQYKSVCLSYEKNNHFFYFFYRPGSVIVQLRIVFQNLSVAAPLQPLKDAIINNKLGNFSVDPSSLTLKFDGNTNISQLCELLIQYCAKVLGHPVFCLFIKSHI